MIKLKTQKVVQSTIRNLCQKLKFSIMTYNTGINYQNATGTKIKIMSKNSQIFTGVPEYDIKLLYRISGDYISTLDFDRKSRSEKPILTSDSDF